VCAKKTPQGSFVFFRDRPGPSREWSSHCGFLKNFVREKRTIEKDAMRFCRRMAAETPSAEIVRVLLFLLSLRG